RDVRARQRRELLGALADEESAVAGDDVEHGLQPVETLRTRGPPSEAHDALLEALAPFSLADRAANERGVLGCGRGLFDLTRGDDVADHGSSLLRIRSATVARRVSVGAALATVLSWRPRHCSRRGTASHGSSPEAAWPTSTRRTTACSAARSRSRFSATATR